MGQKCILEVRNDALDHCIAAGISAGFLACSTSLSVSFCIWGSGMWPEQQVNLKQYKWACLSKALHPPRSSKCLGETMAAHRVPVCLLPWLGTVCFALLRGRTVNLGCVEAGQVSWEIFKDYVVAWEKELQEQSLLPYYTQGSLQGVFIYKSFWMKLVTPCSHCTHSLQAVCCGRCSYSWVSNVWGCRAGRLISPHLCTARVYCFSVLCPEKDRGDFFSVLQWSPVLLVTPLCLGSGHSLGSHAHIHITHGPSLQSVFICTPEVCVRSWVVLSGARSPSESDLLQLCWFQDSCLPVLAVPHPVECSEAWATWWVFATTLDKFLVSQVIWFMPD